jgi:flavin reductase (DIM6/NTAB) family NADH-FMN oxidoreductase RutF
MFYETATNDHGLPYNPLKACVVPRPIGWITTINADGLVNLAPFSFFNVLSYDPPFVLFSAGVHEADGGKKDTVVNAEATRVRLQHGHMGAARSDERNGAPRRARR